LDISLLDVINTAWPILLAIGGIIVAFAQLFSRVKVIEEKVKTLFELWNNRNNK